MSLKHKKVAIVGAGIAGLSIAYNLQKLNIDVKIFEKSSELRNNGLGFLIMSNGMGMFNKMGIENIIKGNGNVIDKFVSVDKYSNVIKSTPIENCLAINRSSCINAIYSQLGEGVVSFGKELKSHSTLEGTDQKILNFKDGSSYTADVLIGADGISSKLRQELFPDHQKTEIKEKEIVGVAKNLELANKLGNTFYKVVNLERGLNMGLLPSKNGEIIWFIQFNENKIPSPENNPVALEKFSKEMVMELPLEFQEIIFDSDFDKAFLWRMYDVDILPSFHKNGIVLIGDSAHPLLSFTSQGVNSALEDAYILANILYNNSEEKATVLFDQFNEIRRPIIQEAINGGRLILDQFLYPEKYSNFKVPFVEHGAK